MLGISPPLLGPDVNEAADNMDGWIRSALDQLAPLRLNKQQRRRASAPWYNPDLKAIKIKCRHLERGWRADYSKQTKLPYKLTFEEYKEAIKNAKRMFFTSKIEGVKTPQESFSRRSCHHPNYIKEINLFRTKVFATRWQASSRLKYN